MRALEVSQETGAVARRKQRLRLTHAGVERFLRGAVRHESLALLDADVSQLIDHRPIALDPGLALDNAIEQHEEALVTFDRGVEILVLDVDEHRIKWIADLLQRVELDPLAVGDRLLNVGVAMAPEVRATASSRCSHSWGERLKQRAVP
jgi:hypothetical protein